MKKFITLIGMMLILTGCGVQAEQGNLTLQSLGTAPDEI